MNKSIALNGSWSDIKEKLKIKFGIITECDFLQVIGRQEAIVGRLQMRLGRSKEEVYKIITEL